MISRELVLNNDQEFIFNSYSEQQVAFPTTNSAQEKMGEGNAKEPIDVKNLFYETQNGSITKQTQT